MNINDKFGSLTFIGMSELKKDGRRTGNFKCDCGKLHTTTLRNVLTGKTKSCGCQRKVGLNPHNRTIHVSYSPKRTFGHFHAQLKESAKRKNLKISISTSDLKKLVLSPCFYCGNKHDVPIGLDRIDSSKGYTEDNVVPACTVCNRMKLNMSVYQFISHIESIHSALVKRGELLETPEKDNQQPSLISNDLEGSTTRNRVLLTDSNIPTSALAD